MAIDYNIMGERIKKARLEKQLTQENIAEKLDVSVAFLSRIERGSSHINLKRLQQLCSILDVSEGYLLSRIVRKMQSRTIKINLQPCKNCCRK